MSRPEYDLAIIGAGASGLIAADFAVQLGARTVLVDRGPIGGDCTWAGCVPSKSLIRAATVAHHARIASRYGIEVSAPVADMTAVRAYLRRTIQQIYEPTMPEALRRKGMDVLIGNAQFLDPHTLEAGTERIRARKFLISTGAEPRIPAIPGLAGVSYSTYQQIFENDRLPQHLLIVGAGPIGCEVAQAYRRLGSRVTIIAERLLPREEPEVSDLLGRVFNEEGIGRIIARAESVGMDGDRIVAKTRAGSATGDFLLVATGRAPLIRALRLEAAKVRFSDQGIEVNRHLQTSARHIYAAGDVIGGPQFSHLAGWQGFQAVRNALLPGNNIGSSPAMPHITFTSPEVAQVGFTQAMACERVGAKKLLVRSFDISRVDRAVNEDDRHGLMKIIARADGTILGATIMGERAGEAITEIAIAMRNKLRLSDLAATIHPYPTYSTGIQLLATSMSVESAFSGLSGRLIRKISALWR